MIRAQAHKPLLCDISAGKGSRYGESAPCIAKWEGANAVTQL